jgi:hypothetical protein
MNPKKKGRNMLNRIANMVDAYKALEYQFTRFHNLINYIFDNLEVNVQKMLIFT